MKVYAVQLNTVWRDKNANFKKVEELLSAAGLQSEGLVVLPEMFATGFDVRAEGIAEGVGNGLVETGQFLARLAQKFQSSIVGSGIAYAKSGKRENLVEVYSPQGQLQIRYQKMYPFTYGGEHKRFDAGEELVTCKVGNFVLSPFICYDLRFPEIFRHATINGAQIITVSANWPSARHSHWLALLLARAIENQCFVIGVNRSGGDQNMEYLGESVIIGPKGEILAQAGGEECVLKAELDVDYLTQWRQSFPVLQDIKKKWLGL